MHEILQICRAYLHILNYSCYKPHVKKNVVFSIFYHYFVLCEYLIVSVGVQPEICIKKFISCNWLTQLWGQAR